MKKNLLPGLILTCYFCAVAQAKSAPAAPSAPDVIVSDTTWVTVPEEIEAVGHMKAIRSVDLSFEVGGSLSHIATQSGHQVKQGDLIAELDDQADEALLNALQAAYQLAQSTYQRMLDVRQYGAVSDQDVDETHAKMLSAQSGLQHQQILIAQKKLKAPFDGVLGSFEYSNGAYLSAGSPLVELVQEAPLLVEYSLPASTRPALEIGQTVNVESSAYPNKIFQGILSFVSPDVTQSTGTLLLQAKIPNEDYLLLPGMFVSIHQIINPNRELLMVPDIALLTDIHGEYVFKLHQSQVEQVPVKVGQIWKDLAEIKSGLAPGDLVVIAGQQTLNSGDTIHLIKTLKTLPEHAP